MVNYTMKKNLKMVIPVLIILVISISGLQSGASFFVTPNQNSNSNTVIIEVGTSEIVKQTAISMSNDFKLNHVNFDVFTVNSENSLQNLIHTFSSNQITIIGHGTENGVLFDNNIISPWSSLAMAINTFHQNEMVYVVTCYSNFINHYINNKENIVAPFSSVLDYRVASSLIVSAFFIQNQMASQALSEISKVRSMKDLILFPEKVLGESCVDASISWSNVNLYAVSFYEGVLQFLLSTLESAIILGSIGGEIAELIDHISTIHDLLEAAFSAARMEQKLLSWGVPQYVNVHVYQACVDKSYHSVYYYGVYLGTNIYYKLGAKLTASFTNSIGYSCQINLENTLNIKTLYSTRIPYGFEFDWEKLSDMSCSAPSGGGGGGPPPRLL